MIKEQYINYNIQMQKAKIKHLNNTEYWYCWLYKFDIMSELCFFDELT